jgi:hypothetical protein
MKPKADDADGKDAKAADGKDDQAAGLAPKWALSLKQLLIRTYLAEFDRRF